MVDPEVGPGREVAELGKEELEVPVPDRSALVDEDGDLGTGVAVGAGHHARMLLVDPADGGRPVGPPGVPHELAEEGAPVDLTVGDPAEVPTHRGRDAPPGVGGICPLDSLLQDPADVGLDLPILLVAVAPLPVVVHLAQGLGKGLLELLALLDGLLDIGGAHELRVVFLAGQACRHLSDEVGDRLCPRLLGLLHRAATREEPDVGELVVGEGAVDGEVRRHIPDPVGLILPSGAVLECEVEGLVLHDSLLDPGGIGSQEERVPVEHEGIVGDGHPGGGDAVRLDLREVADDVAVEGLVEGEGDEGCIHVEGGSRPNQIFRGEGLELRVDILTAHRAGLRGVFLVESRLGHCVVPSCLSIIQVRGKGKAGKEVFSPRPSGLERNVPR